MKKKFLLFTALSAMTLGVSAGYVIGKTVKKVSADGNYHLVLDNTNGYKGENYDATLHANLLKDDAIKIRYFFAKQSEDGHVHLAPHGRIMNSGTTPIGTFSAINGIKKMTINYSSTDQIKIQFNKDLGGNYYTDKIPVSSGYTIDFDALGVAAEYFVIEAGDAEVDISSIDVEYTCSRDDNNRHSLAFSLSDTFTGEKDGIAYMLDFSIMTFRSLNLESNFAYHINSCSIRSSDNVLMVEVDSVGTFYFDVSDDNTKITIRNEGSLGTTYGGLYFTEVKTVEDFESYSSTGTGWDTYGGGHSIFALSGLRSQYHADYYAGSSDSTNISYFKDKNWRIMGSSDYITLNTSNGLDNSKCGVFKFNTNGLRYVSFDSLVARETYIGKGSVFSFWAKGGCTNTSLSTQQGNDVTIKVRLFTSPGITSISDSTSESMEFTIPANSDWTHYEMPLTAGRNYYGYCFYSKSQAQYLPIDQIEMYDVNPYQTYQAPVVGVSDKLTMTAYGRAELSGTAQSLLGDSVPVLVTLGGDESVKVQINGDDAEPTGYFYNKSTGELTIETTGGIEDYGLTYGTITGTVDLATNSITNMSLSGSINSYVANNGSMTCSEAWSDRCNYATNAASQLVWQRWYGSTWTANSGTGEWTTSNSTYVMEEDRSMGLRIAGSSYGRTGFTLKSDFNGGAGLTARGISLWIYNPTSTTYSGDNFRVFGYTVPSTTSGDHAVPGSTFITCCSAKTAVTAGAWTHIQMGFTESTLYNIRIYVAGSPADTTYLYLAHINLY